MDVREASLTVITLSQPPSSPKPVLSKTISGSVTLVAKEEKSWKVGSVTSLGTDRPYTVPDQQLKRKNTS